VQEEVTRDQLPVLARWSNGMDLLRDVTESKRFLPVGLEGYFSILTRLMPFVFRIVLLLTLLDPHLYELMIATHLNCIAWIW
jgi:hypothetical protein